MTVLCHKIFYINDNSGVFESLNIYHDHVFGMLICVCSAPQRDKKDKTEDERGGEDEHC